MKTLFTIGHSNRELQEFIDLLHENQITAVADVRSQPFSEYTPHFNRDPLASALRESEFSYVFLGEELGARRGERCCYVEGKARYDLIAQTPLFQQGLDRIRKGQEKHRVALMCSEKDPLTCHRSILISRILRSEYQIQHIIAAEELESHAQLEERLLDLWRLKEPNLFMELPERVEAAYSNQAEQIAYVEKESSGANRVAN